MRQVFLINGKKRAGKDYVANILKAQMEKRGYKVAVVSFADPLKKVVAGTFGITLEELDEYKNNPQEYPIMIPAGERTFRQIDFRYILQMFGTEGAKPVFGDDIWASLARDFCEEQFQNGIDIIIIPDFRFKVEFLTFSETRFLEDDIDVKTIYISNISIPVNSDRHASETELDTFSFDIRMDNSIKNRPVHIIQQINEFIKL